MANELETISHRALHSVNESMIELIDRWPDIQRAIIDEGIGMIEHGSNPRVRRNVQALRLSYDMAKDAIHTIFAMQGQKSPLGNAGLLLENLSEQGLNAMAARVRAVLDSNVKQMDTVDLLELRVSLDKELEERGVDLSKLND